MKRGCGPPEPHPHICYAPRVYAFAADVATGVVTVTAAEPAEPAGIDA